MYSALDSQLAQDSGILAYMLFLRCIKHTICFKFKGLFIFVNMHYMHTTRQGDVAVVEKNNNKEQGLPVTAAILRIVWDFQIRNSGIKIVFKFPSSKYDLIGCTT